MARRRIWAGTVLLAVGVVMALAQSGSAPASPTSGHEPAAHKMLSPGQLVWSQAPSSLPPGAEMAVLDGNPNQAAVYVVRLRLPDGYRIRSHFHTKDEHITVISGRFVMGTGDSWNEAQMKSLGPGGYFSVGAGERHYAQAQGETIVQLSNMGPFDMFYVNSSDDPRNQRSSR